MIGGQSTAGRDGDGSRSVKNIHGGGGCWGRAPGGSKDWLPWLWGTFLFPFLLTFLTTYSLISLLMAEGEESKFSSDGQTKGRVLALKMVCVVLADPKKSKNYTIVAPRGNYFCRGVSLLAAAPRER